MGDVVKGIQSGPGYVSRVMKRNIPAARNRKSISSCNKDISNLSKLTMNESIRQKTVKSSKRIKQKDNHRQNKPKSQSLTPTGSLKYQWRHNELREDGRNANESEVKAPRKKLSTRKPAWECTIEADTNKTQKSDENKNKAVHKSILKPIAYQDPVLLQLRAEKQKKRTEKSILKNLVQEKKVQQRREIYALNEVMKQLEHAEFHKFCHSAGIHLEE